MIFTFSDGVKKEVKPSDEIFTNLTTVMSVTGDKLPTITGSGYITLRRLTGKSNASLNIFIDGNTQGYRWYINGTEYGVQGDFLKLYFQESISFSGGIDTDTYFYQTLLSDEPVIKSYEITQGITSGTNYITITGKGKIIVSPSYANPGIYYSLDNSKEQVLAFYGYQNMEYVFNESFKFKTSYSSYPLYYIAYTEI